MYNGEFYNADTKICVLELIILKDSALSDIII